MMAQNAPKDTSGFEHSPADKLTGTMPWWEEQVARYLAGGEPGAMLSGKAAGDDAAVRAMSEFELAHAIIDRTVSEPAQSPGSSEASDETAEDRSRLDPRRGATLFCAVLARRGVRLATRAAVWALAVIGLGTVWAGFLPPS